MIKNRKLKKTKAQALAQILILVVGIIAISWMIGGKVGEVSASINCGEGATKCAGNIIMECVGDKWTEGLNCKSYGLSLICKDGKCKAEEKIKLPGDTVIPTKNAPPEQETKITLEQITSLYQTGKLAQGAYKEITSVFGEEKELSLKALFGKIKPETQTALNTATNAAAEAAKTLTKMTWKEFDSMQKYVPEKLRNKIGEEFSKSGGRDIALEGLSKEELAELALAQKKYLGFIPAPSWGGFAYRTVGHIIGNAATAASIYAGAHYAGKLLNVDPNIQRAFDRAGKAGAWTYFATKTASQALRDILTKTGVVVKGKLTETAIKAIGSEFLTKMLAFAITPGFGWIMTGAAIIFSILTFKNERQQIITFDCNVWDAETGGANCEKCNKQGILPCSEYQCRSLGQGCQLINGGTKEEMCANVLCKTDAKYPTINSWQDALISTDYKYTPNNALSPPQRGVYVHYTKSQDKCIPAFTPLSFGITLNEPAKCKYSLTRKDNFNEMDAYLSNGLSKYNHSIIYSQPGSSALESENLTIQNDGNYELYVRCMDACGNYNSADFVFKYCIDKGPDVTAPLIVGTSMLNGGPIGYNQETADLEVYINEPAECKWSTLDQDYDNMENKMSCTTKLIEMNSQMLYTCKTTLTGLKNEFENKFYFRCRDQPSKEANERNTNTESYDFSLLGTRPLIITSAGPDNETIKDATTSVKVVLEAETSAGYKDGEATCSYSETGDSNDYNVFYETNSYIHSQPLWLIEGNYIYYLKCVDLGGNADTKNISFNVDVDAEEPAVVRTYHEDKYLKIITNEKAECVYSKGNVGCNYDFKDGLKINSLKEGTEHFVDWNPDITFYIKCKDNYGNQPARQDECSIVVRAFEISSG